MNVSIPKLLLTTTSLVIGGALAVFLGIRWMNSNSESNAAELALWKAEVKVAKDSAAFYKEKAGRASIEYRDKIVPQYIRVRDAANADPQTSESTRKVIAACDLVVSACDSIQTNLRGQIRNLEAQKNLLENKPGPPRVVGYGDVMYDFIGMRPVFRAGTNLRILGPLHARVEGEYAIPSATREGRGDGFRVLVGARINFNK